MLKQSIFREYDIRGVADVDMPSADVVQMGRALGTFLRRHGAQQVRIGRDVRLSGKRLAGALIEGLLAAGCDIWDLGQVPTPVLYHSVHAGGGAGVMITGSHNPPEYNGFKTMLGGGTIYGGQIQEVYRILRDGDFESGSGSRNVQDAVPAYVDDVVSRFDLPRRIKVVLDAGNGIAGPTLDRVLRRLNVEFVPLFFDPDGSFPNHHPDPTVESNLEHLKAAVRETGAELGLAFDGDSDRLGAIDEKGNVIWGDFLMLIFGREILARKPGATFLGEVKCSQVMYDELARLGGKTIMYKTGHSLIKAKMKEVHAELAGEMSGHLFFADRYHGYDDAIYAACRLIEIVAASGKALSAQTAGLPRMFSTPEIRVDCGDDVKFGIVERVKAHFAAIRPINDIDGVRVHFDDGWGLVRASNTQPILVLRFEAATQEKLDAYRSEVEAVVSEAVRTASP